MKSNIVEIANSTIRKAQNLQATVNSNGVTFDIIHEILKQDSIAYLCTKDFAPHLQGNSTLETCQNIWQFIKENIQYKEDPPGVQYVQSPAALWKNRSGDCKSRSIFTGAILRNLAIPYKYRFVSFDGEELTHVYIVVPTGLKEIIIDTVINKFNAEKQYTYKKDISMTKIVAVSGVPNTKQVKVLVSSDTVNRAQILINTAEQLLTESSKIKDNVNVVITWAQITDLQNKAIVIAKQSSIGSFRPFGWLRGAVDTCVNTINNLSGKVLGIGLGDVLLTGLLGATGLGAAWQIIKIGAKLGFTVGRIVNTGISCSLTSYQFHLLQYVPNTPGVDSDNYNKLVLALGLQILALKNIIAELDNINSNYTMNGIGDIFDTITEITNTGSDLDAVQNNPLDVSAWKRLWKNAGKFFSWATGKKEAWAKYSGTQKEDWVSLALNSMVVRPYWTDGTNGQKIFDDFFKLVSKDEIITDSQSKFFNENNWVVKRVSYKYNNPDFFFPVGGVDLNKNTSFEQLNQSNRDLLAKVGLPIPIGSFTVPQVLNIIRNSGSNPSIDMKTNANLFTWIQDIINNKLHFNVSTNSWQQNFNYGGGNALPPNPGGGNANVDDLTLQVDTDMYDLILKKGIKTLATTLTGHDVITLLATKSIAVPTTIKTRDDLYNWILTFVPNAAVIPATGTSSNNTLLLLGAVLAAKFLLFN